MTESITKVAASPPAIGQTVAFRKDRGKQGKGDADREPTFRPRHVGMSGTTKGSAQEHGKGNLIDIRA